MHLLELKKGQSATIIKIHADKILRNRLSSFGIMCGESVVIKGSSLAKQTIEIKVGSTLIALRADEAEKIEISLN